MQGQLAIMYLCALFCLWLGHLIANHVWLAADMVPLMYDAHKFHITSIDVFTLLKDFSWDTIPAIIQAHPLHPFLIGLITPPWYFIFGYTPDTAVLIHTSIFLGLLIASTYLLGSLLYNRPIGLLSAFLISLFPGITAQYRVFMLDLPLTAIVIWSTYALFKTRFFSHRGWTVVWAFSLLSGLLIKSNMIGFMITPVCWALVQRHKNNQSLIKPLVYCFLCLLIPLVYYVPHYHTLEKYFAPLVQLRVFPAQQLAWHIKGFIASVGAYLKLFFFFQLLPLFALLTFFSFWHNRKKPYNTLLILSCVLPLLGIAFLRPGTHPEAPWIHTRHLLPLLPFCAISISSLLFSLPHKNMRTLLVAIIMIFGIAQYTCISFAGPLQIPLPSSHLSHPVKASWDKPIENIITRLLTYQNNNPDKNVTVLLLHDIGELWGGMQYRIITENLPITFYCDSLDIYGWNAIPLPELIEHNQYVLLSDKPQLKATSAAEEQKALNYFKTQLHSFRLVDSLPIPSGDTLLIYQALPEKS